MIEVHTEDLEKPVNTDAKFNLLIWTDEETKIVGEFLSGRGVAITDTERAGLWDEIKTTTDFSPEETPRFIANIKGRMTPDNSLTEVSTADEDDEESPIGKEAEKLPEAEYSFTVKKTAHVIQQIVADSLRKFGVWGTDDSRRVKPYAGVRREGKKTYAQDDIVGKDVETKGYISPSEGGPSLIEAIYPPRLSESKNTSDSRTRRSLAHEIQHVIRSLTNKNVWAKFEEEARKHGLKEPDTEEKKKYIGGFSVGSNFQGSEEVGEVFSRTIEFRLENGKDPTVADLIPLVEARVASGVRKIENKLVEGKKPSIRYLPAKFALLEHLKGLNQKGYGNIPAIDLVALGSCGYISFEKAPELIQLGVVDQDKYQKMRRVVRNISEWLTSPSESGFRITPQNI